MNKPTYHIETVEAAKPEVKKTVIVIGNGGLELTLTTILKTINENAPLICDFAETLKGDTLQQTAFNIWHYLKTNTIYTKDKPGFEEIRTPQRTIDDKKGDCDDYSIFSASVLKNLGYEPFLYVVAFRGSETYAHIYCGIENIVIDGVMSEFDKHPEHITKTMLLNLNGKRTVLTRSPENINISKMVIQQLSGLAGTDINDFISSEYQRLSGLGQLTEEETEDYNKIRVLKLLEGNPHREYMLQIMPHIAGIDENMDIYFNTEIEKAAAENLLSEYETLLGLGDVDGIGKLFDKFKETVKKVTAKVKTKIKKDVAKLKVISKKVSDVTKKVALAPARGALLVLLRLNFLKFGSKLWLSYLTDKQITEYGIEPEAFKKLVEFRQKFESFWEKAGGDKKAIFEAVSKRGKKIAEKNAGLGIAVAAATGGSVAVASPFLIFLKSAWAGVKSIFKNFFKKGGIKEGAKQIKEAYSVYKEANTETPTDEEMLNKAMDNGGSDLVTDNETPETETKSNILPLAIGAAILAALFM